MSLCYSTIASFVISDKLARICPPLGGGRLLKEKPSTINGRGHEHLCRDEF
jgi:hypothetical protein